MGNLILEVSILISSWDSGHGRKYRASLRLRFFILKIKGNRGVGCEDGSK